MSPKGSLAGHVCPSSRSHTKMALLQHTPGYPWHFQPLGQGSTLLRSPWDLLAHAHFASSYPTRAPLARSTPGSPGLQLLQLQPCHQGNLNVQYPETLSSCLIYLQPDSQSYQAHTVDPEDIPIQGYSLKTVKGSCFV